MLSKEQLLFLRILKCAISNEQYDIAIEQTDTSASFDLKQLFRLGRIHKVLPMVCETVHRSPGISKDPLYKRAEKEAVRAVAGQVIRSAQFSDLYLFLIKRGLRPIVVKGIIVRQLYPRGNFRESVDEDLWIEQEKAEEYYKAFRDYGLSESTNTDGKHEELIRSFVHPLTQLNVDIHTFSLSGGTVTPGHLEGIFTHSSEVEINGVLFRTLQPADHLFYLIMHAFKHFLHSGFGIRQVCDIVLYAEHYRDEIDWTTLAEKLKNARAFEFTLAVFKIGVKYLLNDSHLEALLLTDSIETNSVNEEPLLMDILEGGLYGSASMTRLHSSTVTIQAVMKNSAAGHSPFRIIISSVFLPIGKMRSRYTYLNKMPFLLPIAWGQRVCHYLTELFTSRKESNTALKTNNVIESIRLGQERLKLLKEYHIID